jgi:signal transduction histidine kinase
MPVQSWATQQLAEFLAAVSSAETEASAAHAAVERTAEALDAEVAAIVRAGDLVAAVGYPEGAVPVADLTAITPGAERCELLIPGAGRFPATAVALEYPADATLIVARSRTARLSPDEAGLLRGMARVTAMTIANVEARAELAASRARVIAAADQERRRVVRDLHDGAQQRLVHAVITLKLARRALQKDDDNADELLDEALSHAERANFELRELAHGILPTVLTRDGLQASVETLAGDISLPVGVDVSVGRLTPAVEATAYFVVCEALTNVVKHARAHSVEVGAHVTDGILRIEVHDDGVGGARLDGGSGLLGVADRLSALNGKLEVESPSGAGTSIVATLPVPS